MRATQWNCTVIAPSEDQTSAARRCPQPKTGVEAVVGRMASWRGWQVPA